MCLIAYRPKGSGNIPNAVIDTAMTRHPDGFGVTYRKGGNLCTERFAPNARKAFRKALKRIDATGAEYVAHFRYATSGPTDQHHAHPYEYHDPLGNRVLVFHNGVISLPHDHVRESDTEAFVRDVLAYLPPRWWTMPAMRYMVGEAIGWSRLVLMTDEETVNLQERNGTWDGGLWYSSEHRPTKRVATVPNPPKVTHVPKAQWVQRRESASADRYEAMVEAATKSAEDSYHVLMTDTESDPWDDMHFHHGGHNVTAMRPIERSKGDREYTAVLLCDTCYTVGDAYVIDGEVLIDMGHRFGPLGETNGTNASRALVPYGAA